MKNLQKLLTVAFLQLLMGLSITCQGQQPGETSYTDNLDVPGGKLGEVLQNLIATVNANDTSKVRNFLETFYVKDFRDAVPMEKHQEVFLNLYKTTGGVEFYSMRSYNPSRPGVTMVIKDKNYQSWRAVSVSFADKKEYLINGMRFLPTDAPPAVRERNITVSDLLNETGKMMNRICEKDVFSGAILIANGKQVLYEKACGEASKRFHVANNPDTKFSLGSMNKMFTAVAIMQLVEKGKVNLDDPISKYVDESWLPEEITNKVTVHHLLTHTSGLGSYFNRRFLNSSRALFRTVDDYKPLVQGDTLAFEPGERFKYSNTGMLLLGVVIEKATGQDYFEYIRQNIYQPSGMTNTDSYEMDQPVENLAIGYSPAGSEKYKYENNLFKSVIKGGPAGGGFSTVRDLHKFALALSNEKLVSRSSLDLLWKDHSKSGYGYGFSVELGASGKIVGHSGGFPGISSNLDIFLKNGYIVAVMSNYDRATIPVADKVSQLISRLKN